MAAPTYPLQDDLVGGPATQAPQTNNLVEHPDPIVAALLASGYPVQPTPLAGQPGVQQMSASDGPITSPAQMAPTAPAPSAPATAQPGTTLQPIQEGQNGIQTITRPAPLAAAEQLASGDVKGANAQQESALNTQTNNIVSTELAKTDALAQHASARATIYDGHATAQGLIDNQYQVAREKARNDANAETAVWMRDLDKKVAEEPVPGRWWASENKFGQVMYLASLVFGSLAQSKNPNIKNIGLDMIVKETEADVAEQRAKLQRQVDIMKMKGQQIDKRLQAQLDDSKDDHGLLVQRLAMVQQAALERANAPGPADQKAAMAEAAQWAGQQRLTIAGERANRAYAEREGGLNRDAEMARAMLVDKRDRAIAAATIQKDYDLARLQASVKLEGAQGEKFKDTAVLPPGITGIKVLDKVTGKPIVTPVSPNGGLVYNTKREGLDKELRQDAELAQDHYATLKRISAALGKDEDLTTLLKGNAQLVSDLQKIGYQTSKDNDPRGIVTDKDLTSGMETATGGDLNSLSGRIASASFSAGQGEMKKVVDKAIRDFPFKMSKRFGSRLDASIPGYEGDVRVDWTPKQVEMEAPTNPSKQAIDSSYGIKTPVKPPQSVEELAAAQALEAKGVEALPQYKPESQDKVTKALEDFKGATPETINARGRAVTDELYKAGDTRAVLEVQQAKYAEMKKAAKRLDEVESSLKAYHMGDDQHAVWSKLSSKQQTALAEDGKIPVDAVVEVAKRHGITQLSGQDVLDIIKKTGLKPYTE